MFRCHCTRPFKDSSALRAHQSAKEHFACMHCDRDLRSPKNLEKHTCGDRRWKCNACDEVFISEKRCVAHQKSLSHCYCRECDRFFARSVDLSQHNTDLKHATHFRCCVCSKEFPSEAALYQHLDSNKHKKKPSITYHDCKDCGRRFATKEALGDHQSSLIHRPLSDLRCIAGNHGKRGCRKRFKSPSALLSHLESGACPSGTTRRTLNKLVQDSDVNRIVTASFLHNQLRTTEDKPDMTVSGCQSISTPSEGGVILTPSSGSDLTVAHSPPAMTPSSGSSELWEIFKNLPSTKSCPLCPASRRPFATTIALQQHLLSPVHDPIVFRCPIPFLPINHLSIVQRVKESEKSFSTLSGLAQHLESGACEGGKSAFQHAASNFEELLSQIGFGSITFLK